MTRTPRNHRQATVRKRTTTLHSSNRKLSAQNEGLRGRNLKIQEINRALRYARNYSDAILKTVREPLIFEMCWIIISAPQDKIENLITKYGYIDELQIFDIIS